MHAPTDYLSEGFAVAMAVLSAITLWIAIYLPDVQKTKQLSLRSIIVLTALFAVAFAAVRFFRW